MEREPCIVDLSLDLAARDVLAMMCGGSQTAVETRVLNRLNDWLHRCAPNLQSQAVYVVRDVEHVDDAQVRLVGCPPVNGPIAKYLRPARRVAVFVVSIGRFVHDQVCEAQGAGRTLDHRILQALGAAALDAAVDALMEHLWTNEAGPEEGITLPVSPGSCGMDWTQNEPLYAVVRERTSGFDFDPLTPDSVCSLAGLAGIGWAGDVEAHAVPCEFCTLEECVVRRGRRQS